MRIKRRILIALMLLLWLLGSAARAEDCQEYAAGMRWVTGLDFGSSSSSDICFHGEIAYAAMDYLEVVDVGDPESPVALGRVDDRNGYLYTVRLSGGEFRLAVFDISSPGSGPYELVGSVATAFGPMAAEMRGAYAFVVGSATLVEVFDIGDPALPTPVRTISFFGRSPVDITIEGDLAYVAVASDHLFIAGGSLYVADLWGGRQMFDARDPVQPLPRGGIDVSGGSWGVTVNGSVVCVASEWRLNIVPFDCLTSSGLAGESPLPARPFQLSAHPNPFNPKTRIRYTLAAPISSGWRPTASPRRPSSR